MLMAIRIVTTHVWTKVFILIKYISFFLCIGLIFTIFSPLEPILGGTWIGVVGAIVLFIGAIWIYGVTILPFYDNLETYLYIKINLGVDISFNEAKCFLLLFAPNYSGKWYPMTGLKDLPKSVRRKVLFESAKKIYRDLGYKKLDLDKAYKSNIDSTQKNEIFIHGFSYLVSMLCKLAKSDNVISKDELLLINHFFVEIAKLSQEDQNEAMKIFGQAQHANIPFEVYARNFYEFHRNHKELLVAVVVLLTRVAFADGELSAEEDILINEVISIFGVGESAYEDAKASFYAAKYKHHNADRHYAKILGITGEITLEKVKASYRELVLLYHPDRLSHLGESMRKVAEEKMKLINGAYEHFKKKFVKLSA